MEGLCRGASSPDPEREGSAARGAGPLWAPGCDGSSMASGIKAMRAIAPPGRRREQSGDGIHPAGGRHEPRALRNHLREPHASASGLPGGSPGQSSLSQRRRRDRSGALNRAERRRAAVRLRRASQWA